MPSSPTCSSSLLKADPPPCPAGLSMQIPSCPAPLPFPFSYSVYQHNPRFRVQSPSRSDHFSAGHLDPWPPVKLPGLYHWPLYSFLITASRPFKHKLDRIPALSKTYSELKVFRGDPHLPTPVLPGTHPHPITGSTLETLVSCPLEHTRTSEPALPSA